MTDTVRTRTELEELFPIGIKGGITGQALRDFLASASLSLEGSVQFFTVADSSERRAGEYAIGDYVRQTDNGHLYLLRAISASNSASWYDLGAIRADDEESPVVPATYFTYKGNGEGFKGYFAVEINKSNLPFEPVVTAFETQWTNSMGATSDDYEWVSINVAEITSDDNNWYLILGTDSSPEFQPNATIRIRYSDPQSDWTYLRSHVIFFMPGEYPEGMASIEAVLEEFRNNIDGNYDEGQSVFTLGDQNDSSFDNYIFIEDVTILTEFYPSWENIYGTLNLSGFINLEYVDIGGNPWIEVCVLGCERLIEFYCEETDQNQHIGLTSINVSNLPALSYVALNANPALEYLLATGWTGAGGKGRFDIENCNLTEGFLNVFFSSLGNADTDNSKNELNISNNPGSPTCDPTIATNKGWYVNGAYENIAPPQNVQGSQTEGMLQVILTWDAVEHAVSYQIQRNTGGGWQDYAYDVTDLTFTDDAVEGGTIYSYCVIANGDNNRYYNSNYSSEVSIEIIPTSPQLATPQVTAVQTDRTVISISWSAIENAEIYVVERSRGSEEWFGFASTPSITVDDTNVELGQTYHYQVKAFADAYTASEWSGYNSTTVELPRLAMPQNIIASQTDLEEVTVTWGAVENATSYAVGRQRWDGAWVEQTTLIVYTNSFVGSVVAPNRYMYFVLAQANTYSDSEFNAAEVTVTATLPLATPVPVVEQTGAAEITITWSAIPHAASYLIGRESGGGWVRPFASGITSPYVDTNDIGVGRTYTYILSAVGDTGYVDSESGQIGVTIT